MTSFNSGKRHSRIPEVLNEAERESLLAQPSKRAPTGRRDYAMISLMVNAGLRSNEARSLRTDEVDFMSGKLTVRNGKGSKDRIVWLNDQDLEAVRKWRERKPISPLLFPTLKGTKISDVQLRTMVTRRAKKAGIATKHVTPHTLRHSFATDLLRDTKNIRLVQKSLGHANLATTMIYTHIFDEELESGMKNLRRPQGAMESDMTVVTVTP